MDEPFDGRYRIERELGRGGMATVFLARDLKHDGRLVGIKFLRPEIAALLGPDRFLREIDLVARLNHPHILPLYDSGEFRSGAGTGPSQLYYVMPYVEGGTLADRLSARPRMPVTEALDLTLQVADALTYAHAHDVVHRDIKPANILLAERHAYVADFGIARAIRRAMTTERLTDAGLVLGTPTYMAPEQFQSGSKVDGRADEYALACVLFEALSGAPPEPAASWSNSAPPSLRKQRPDLSANVDLAIGKALSISPTQRFASIADFAAALRGVGPAAARGVGVKLTGRHLVILGSLALTTALLLGRDQIFPAPVVQPDTTRYALLPFEYGKDVPITLEEDQRLRSSFRRWRGIEPVDPVRVREAVGQRGSHLSSADAVAISRAVNAGRYLRGTVSLTGDSLRVSGALYEVQRAGDSLLAEHTVWLSMSQLQAEQPVNELVDHLLLRGPPPLGGLGGLGTQSLPAWQAFSAGQQAIREWRLSAADSALGLAGQYDPEFIRSQLWLGVGRLWSHEDPVRWQHAAEQAALGKDRLSGSERLMVDALVAAARGEIVSSCRAWQALSQTAPDDFASWYGWAYCLATDEAVVHDHKSPSGWRFRSSYRGALQAYRRAFLLRTSVLAAFSQGSYRSIRALLMTSGSDLRFGAAVSPDSTRFLAWPEWIDDTLGFVPYPIDRFQTRPPGTPTVRAVREQRQLFHQVAVAWVTAAPRSADALEALAISLEMLGDPSSIDTLVRARGLTRSPSEYLRVAGAEVWARVRFGIPDSPKQLGIARVLADSLLQRFPVTPPAEPELLASLAALTGHAGLATAHAQQAAILDPWTTTRPLLDIAPALLTFAAMGGPTDTLRSLAAQALAMVEHNLPAGERDYVLSQWIGRAASLAFPAWDTAGFDGLAGKGYVLLDAQAAFRRGDFDSARAVLRDLERMRQSVPPAARTLDALFPEARLLLALGDTAAATGWMRPTLTSLQFTSPEVLADPWRAASLVRAMALQASLAEQAGDHSASARWARCVLALWAGADVFLQPDISRLKRLAN